MLKQNSQTKKHLQSPLYFNRLILGQAHDFFEVNIWQAKVNASLIFILVVRTLELPHSLVKTKYLADVKTFLR